MASLGNSAQPIATDAMAMGSSQEPFSIVSYSHSKPAVRFSAYAFDREVSEDLKKVCPVLHALRDAEPRDPACLWLESSGMR